MKVDTFVLLCCQVRMKAASASVCLLFVLAFFAPTKQCESFKLFMY